MTTNECRSRWLRAPATKAKKPPFTGGFFFLRRRARSCVMASWVFAAQAAGRYAQVGPPRAVLCVTDASTSSSSTGAPGP